MIPKLAVLLGLTVCALLPFVVGASVSQNNDVTTFADVIKSRSVRSTCGYDSCNRFCRSLGHARGVCIGTYCQCRFRRRRAAEDTQDLEKITLEIANEKAAVTENEPVQIHSDTSADVILSRSRRSCGAGECNAHCKKLGHARGVCIGTYCQCRSRLRRSLDHVDENDTKTVENSTVTDKDQEVSSGTFTDVILSRSRRSCGAGECNAHCKKLGHARGVCIGTYCQCRSR